MANTSYYVSWDSTALVAATAKTILEFPVPANVSPSIIDLIIGCDSSAAGWLKVEFGKFTTTGTGTTVAATDIQKLTGDRSVDSSINPLKIKDTVEPTGFSSVASNNALYPTILLPLPIYFPWQYPLGREFTVPESLNFAIRLTASVSCNTAGEISWVE